MWAIFLTATRLVRQSHAEETLFDFIYLALKKDFVQLILYGIEDLALVQLGWSERAATRVAGQIRTQMLTQICCVPFVSMQGKSDCLDRAGLLVDCDISLSMDKVAWTKPAACVQERDRCVAFFAKGCNDCSKRLSDDWGCVDGRKQDDRHQVGSGVVNVVISHFRVLGCWCRMGCFPY